MTKRATPEIQRRMFALVAQWQSSSLSRVDFCRQHSITVKSFEYWQRKSKRVPQLQSRESAPVTSAKTEAVSARFIPFELDRMGASLSLVKLNFPNGVVAEIYAADIELIGHLIKIY